MGARATSRSSTRIQRTSTPWLRQSPRSPARRRSALIRRRTTRTFSSPSAVRLPRPLRAGPHRSRDVGVAAVRRVPSSRRGLSSSSNRDSRGDAVLFFGEGVMTGSKFVPLACLAVVTVLVVSPAARDDAPRIVALGDSLTSGYGIGKADAYPAVLQRRLEDGGY